jgi:predicted Zn-ribbon and HTH transcriptional regulator
MITVFICKRCGHEWASKQIKPIICPKCKSPYWNKERKNYA